MTTHNKKRKGLRRRKKQAAKRAYQRLRRKRHKQLELMEAMGADTAKYRKEWNMPDNRTHILWRVDTDGSLIYYGNTYVTSKVGGAGLTQWSGTLQQAGNWYERH